MNTLSYLPRPFIVNVVTDRSVAAAIATMRLAALEGAHAHEVNLPLLGPMERGIFATLAGAVRQPVYASCRRAAFLTVYGVDPTTLPSWQDGERMTQLLEAVRGGACAIDIELDTFAPNPAPPLGTPAAARFATIADAPAEFTDEPEAVERQRQLIHEVHALGAEVILSCHTGRVLPSDAIVAIARDARDRGADVVKIVTACLRRRDLYQVLEAIATIATTISIPFTVVGTGPAGRLSRAIGTRFGASYALGQLSLTPGGFHDQPLVAQLRELHRLLPGNPEDLPA